MSGAQKPTCRYPVAQRLFENGTASPQVRQAVELLLEDKVIREIAAEMEISISRARELLSDPTGEKAAERKSRVYGFCVDCGTKIFNAGSPDLPERCGSCAPKHRRKESQRQIVEAIRDWRRRFGRNPSAMDWNINMALASAHPARLARIEQAHRDRQWPGCSSVQAAFGSWNAAIEASGFQPMRPGQRIDPDTHREHMKGSNMLSPTTVIEREIEKNKQRKQTLAEQIVLLDKNVDQLEQAKALLTSGAKG